MLRKRLYVNVPLVAHFSQKPCPGRSNGQCFRSATGLVGLPPSQPRPTLASARAFIWERIESGQFGLKTRFAFV